MIKEAIDGFLDRLSGADRVALIGLGRGTRSIPFTADRNRIKEAVAGMNGEMRARSTPPMFRLALSLEAALEITRGNTATIEMFVESCTELNTSRGGRDFCEAEIMLLAREALQNATEPRDATIRALADALTSLRSIDAPKSLVLVSEGLALFDGDEEVRSQMTALGSLAAAARTSIYALRLDDQRIDVASAGRQVSPGSDTRIRIDGLEALTTGSRGALFTVATTGVAAFDRIESELSGSYLLGVETPPDIVAGQSSPLRVEVARRGVTIRARAAFTAPASQLPASARSTQVAAATALTTPVTMSDLPLRVISFNFQGPDPSKVQLLIHADVGQSVQRASERGRGVHDLRRRRPHGRRSVRNRKAPAGEHCRSIAAGVLGRHGPGTGRVRVEAGGRRGQQGRKRRASDPRVSDRGARSS